MKFKNIFFSDEENTEKGEVSTISYGELLDLNRAFKFNLSKSSNITNDCEFECVKTSAINLLKADLNRLDQTFYEIDAGLRNKLLGSIGTMVLIVDKSGNAQIRFHKRNAKGIWDDVSKTYPEKFVSETEKETTKFRYELFFILEDEE